MSRKKPNGLRQPDPQKTPKIWEKARREKMKVYFNELQEVLPFYDPSAPMSRFEILQKARTYIKDLQEQNQDLLNGGFDEVYKDKMERLKVRVKELLQRVDQLSDLLRTANIMIPPLAPGTDNQNSNSHKWINQRPKKWTEKINLVVPNEKIDNMLLLIKDFKKKSSKVTSSKKVNKKTEKLKCDGKQLEKHENKDDCKKSEENGAKETEKNNSDNFTESQSPSHTKENQPIDFNLISEVEEVSKKSEKTKCKNSDESEKTKKTKTNLVKPQNNVFIPSQPNTFLLTSDGNLVQVPIVNQSITPLVINRPSPVIVLQKPAPQVIVNTTPQILSVPKPSVQILGNSVIYASSNPTPISKQLPYILSKPPANKKRIARDSTVTTYVNKIPIPALSKQSYAKKSPISSVSSKTKKSKEVEKPVEKGEEKEKEPEKEAEKEKDKNKEKEKSEEPAAKKQKLSDDPKTKEILTSCAELDKNLFKPIDNPSTSDEFCNLKLPNALNPSLSVSPTAAFLSSFPIVSQSKADENEETPSKSPTDKNEQEKEKEKEKEKTPDELQNVPQPTRIPHLPQTPAIPLIPPVPPAPSIPSIPPVPPTPAIPPVSTVQNIRTELIPKNIENTTSGATITTSTVTTVQNIVTSNNNIHNNTKTWQFQPQSQPQLQLQPQPQKTSQIQTDIFFPPVNSFPESINFNMSHDQIYMQKNTTFNNNSKKQCSNDSYKNYQTEPAPSYQLIPAKEPVRNANHQNPRPPVNWMTDPDVRSRSMNYNDKIQTNNKPYVQADPFYMTNQNDFPNENNKINYQQKTNDFYVNKNVNKEKRSDPKCQNAPVFKPQNSYNIFDYNYNSCYQDEDPNKYCANNNSNPQTFNNKNSKKVAPKKKMENFLENNNDLTKRNSDILPIDFNPIPNQEGFSWIPGKNMDWLSGKFDTNLVVPSTLPTLVGDLALGNETTQTKKPCQKNQDATKNYIDLNLTNNFAKPMETPENQKQFLEPFVNLSKNIFDLNPGNQNPKNNFPNNNNTNETIELKNIFELPTKNFNGNANNASNNTKQRSINQTQNTFLSVSQLVETPNFDNTIKPDIPQDNPKADSNFYQNYHNHNTNKSYKNKNRNCKYENRKYQYKNSSSNYTAEALIRSNNVNFQTNDFPDPNQNFFNKPQKDFSAPQDPKTDFVGPSQNIYGDFNFSSPVSNFNIGMNSTDFVNHDANFSSQNNSFFGDFIPAPEYPLTESVSNPLLLPPCSIGLQNHFIIEKRPNEKTNPQKKNYSNSRNSRKHYECKSNYNDFSINTTGAIFTNSTLTCPPIFTSSAGQNLLNQNTENITFTGSTFSTNNIAFPPNTTFHRFSATNSLTTMSSTIVSSSQNCFLTNPTTSVTNSVITTPFSVGNVGTQSGLPFLSLSNPIIPPSIPSTSGNSLANFNLSTIFPEINQKGNYHYP